MAFAQGSRSRLSYITESTYGTTPAGDFTGIPFNTQSLNLAKDRVSSAEIRDNRQMNVDRHGNKQVGGDIAVELCDTDFEPFLESLMMSTFSTGVLKTGTTLKSFSIEDYAANIDQARLFTGCAVSSGSFSIAPNQMVTSTFTLLGKDMTLGATEKTVTSGTPSGNAPFDAYSGSISIGGSASSIITNIDFTVDNGFNPTFVVGSDVSQQIDFGMSTVEGTLSAYFEDEALINRFLNETETAIEVQVGDGTNTMTFLFPRCKINSADVGVDGPNARIITASFVALYDSTEDTNLKITAA